MTSPFRSALELYFILLFSVILVVMLFACAIACIVYVVQSFGGPGFVGAVLLLFIMGFPVKDAVKEYKREKAFQRRAG